MIEKYEFSGVWLACWLPALCHTALVVCCVAPVLIIVWLQLRVHAS